MSALSSTKEFLLGALAEIAQVGGLSISQLKEKDARMEALMDLKDGNIDEEIIFDAAEGSQEPEEGADKEESKGAKDKAAEVKAIKSNPVLLLPQKLVNTGVPSGGIAVQAVWQTYQAGQAWR